ncbi:MAG: aminomethyl-transferring glycine dehydrogenase, partial [Planctomycetota bacterium]|nr:aminomethyl-transferring glycine dehydrogenase [Planctomycetota bacterium]
MTARPAFLEPTDTFVRRHVGPTDADVAAMLDRIGVPSLDALVDETIPSAIRLGRELALPAGLGESAGLASLAAIADRNQVTRSWIGMGYHGAIVPPVIQRNVLENPSWYTQYTPYQAEISQGRLEALLNFQTMVADLCGLPLAGSSLLDEGTAAAEAMALCWAAGRKQRDRFVISQRCHPQTIAVVQTRAEAIGMQVEVGDLEAMDFEGACGVLDQYPDTYGRAVDLQRLADRVHDGGALYVVATDLLALTLLTPPGEFGADVVLGNSQRFGVPMGFGGPHAAFLATRDEFKRQIPGRLIGVSKDRHGAPALRMALQTREQHIRRDKATSNICTAQVLLAIMAGMYAVYHGPKGLKAIATRVHGLTKTLHKGLEAIGYRVAPGAYFDTLRVMTDERGAEAAVAAAAARGIDLRPIDETSFGVSFDESTNAEDVEALLLALGATQAQANVELLATGVDPNVATGLARTGEFLTHPIFHSYHSEHEMLRYIHRLAARDLSLTTSMIPLGSCTMKLNATSEMLPVTWPSLGALHPFAPAERTAGYQQLFRDLESWLGEITGFAGVSLQPNAGSQGEFAGMLVIRAHHQAQGQGHRDVCLIPTSAHGTNPASAVMAGMRVVAVACDVRGNVDVDDLRAKAEKHADALAAIMITYPSTHGVFETRIREICTIVHEFGGQVYLDGANMNAQVGLCRPGDYGADVC